MSDTVLAALIGAITSIVVALIGKQTAHGERLESRSTPGRQLPPRAWLVTLAALALWLLLSPGAIDVDLGATNFLLIPVVLLILAVASPIRPLTAAWTSLAIYSANFILGPLGGRLGDHDTPFGRHVLPFFAIGFIAAALVAGVCALRLRQQHPLEEPSRRASHPGEATPDDAFTSSLEKLAALHSDGKLSDEEFRAAKKRLLDGQ